MCELLDNTVIVACHRFVCHSVCTVGNDILIVLRNGNDFQRCRIEFSEFLSLNFKNRSVRTFAQLPNHSPRLISDLGNIHVSVSSSIKACLYLTELTEAGTVFRTLMKVGWTVPGSPVCSAFITF